MKKTALYQAIDGGRKAVPETPIYCSTSDARLGFGYYFWDSIIGAAHWWGKQRYGENNYIICQSFYDAHSDKYFDLVGNLLHKEQLKSCADKLRARGRQGFALAEVLEGLREVCPEFDDLYWAIRAEAVNKHYLDRKQDFPLRKEEPTSCEDGDISFARGTKLVLSCGLRVQLCVTNLAFLLEGEYTAICYPEYRDASYMA